MPEARTAQPEQVPGPSPASGKEAGTTTETVDTPNLKKEITDINSAFLSLTANDGPLVTLANEGKLSSSQQETAELYRMINEAYESKAVEYDDDGEMIGYRVKTGKSGPDGKPETRVVSISEYNKATIQAYSELAESSDPDVLARIEGADWDTLKNSVRFVDKDGNGYTYEEWISNGKPSSMAVEFNANDLYIRRQAEITKDATPRTEQQQLTEEEKQAELQRMTEETRRTLVIIEDILKRKADVVYSGTDRDGNPVVDKVQSRKAKEAFKKIYESWKGKDINNDEDVLTFRMEHNLRMERILSNKSIQVDSETRKQGLESMRREIGLIQSTYPKLLTQERRDELISEFSVDGAFQRIQDQQQIVDAYKYLNDNRDDIIRRIEDVKEGNLFEVAVGGRMFSLKKEHAESLARGSLMAGAFLLFILMSQSSSS